MSEQAQGEQGGRRGIGLIPERYKEGEPDWGISTTAYKSGVRIAALIAGIAGILLTNAFHIKFFGDSWKGMSWGGPTLALMVTVSQFVLLHRGHKDIVLVAGGVLCWGYDILAVTLGLMLAASGQSPLAAVGETSIVGDAFFFVMGALISIMSEALIAFGLLKGFWVDEAQEHED